MLETSDLMPWPEVARRLGVSTRTARRLCETALTKLRMALEADGVTEDVVAAYFRERDRTRVLNTANLAALLTDVEPPVEDEVLPYRSLRGLV